MDDAEWCGWLCALWRGACALALLLLPLCFLPCVVIERRASPAQATAMPLEPSTPVESDDEQQHTW